MPLPRALAELNRRVGNPIVGTIAGTTPGFGIVTHRGRHSGRVYRSPVMVFRRGGGYRIALAYGRDADWLKNIRAAREFELETLGRTVTLTSPTIGRDATAAWAPPPVRQVLTALAAEYYVQARPITAAEPYRRAG